MLINEDLLIEVCEKCELVLENYDEIKSNLNYYEHQIKRYENNSDFQEILNAFKKFVKKGNYYINIKSKKDKLALCISIVDTIIN